jgi:transposase-like protein
MPPHYTHTRGKWQGVSDAVIVSKLVKKGYKGEIREDFTIFPEIQDPRHMEPMRLNLILPVVDPEEFKAVEECPYPKCGGKHFKCHQEVAKAVRDSKYEQVQAMRYRCLKCQRTFRVYPQGIQASQVSQRVKGLAVMLYLLGLSYGAVAIMTEALGVFYSKTSVYQAVQAAAKAVPGLKRSQIANGYRSLAMGGDLTYVRCNGKWLPLGVIVDPIQGLVLSIDQLAGEDAQTLQEWIAPIADQVGAQVLVSDDADAFKQAADQSGLDQQVCKSHVVRNTEELITSLSSAIANRSDGSLARLDIAPEQALADLKRLGELIHSRQPQEQAQVQALYERYAAAPAPKPGRSATIAYRMRILFLDRWNLWPRLTFYRTWKDRQGQPLLDGTNNADERAIGWWVKERYRSMRGYKREQSAVNVSRLLAYCGNHLSQGLDLAAIVA